VTPLSSKAACGCPTVPPSQSILSAQRRSALIVLSLSGVNPPRLFVVGRAARDPELPYSITSSARRSVAVGTLMASAFAALRLRAVVGSGACAGEARAA
jgi:hypothetical protein